MKNKNIDISLMLICLLIIVIVVALLAIFPQQSTDLIGSLFTSITDNFGTLILWFGFLVFLYCLYMAFSKHGNVLLGDKDQKPDYSMFQYISMMICAGLGAAAVIWSFVEWAYYYSSPALGIEPMTPLAAEWSTAYNLFHWGFTPWAMFVVLAIPVSYAFHVRKIPALRFSNICATMIGEKSYTKPICRLIDFFFVFCVVGGLSVTLGLGIPIIASGIGTLFNFEPTFLTNVIITIFIAALFSLSSYVGIDKGMKYLSTINIYAAIIFILGLLFTGPTRFILKQISTGLGRMLQNYVIMSMWADPIQDGGFPEAWTIFFYAFGIVYAALMALFITKVSRGRTMRQMICSVIFGGGGGCFIFFGINGSFSMNLQLTGKMDVVSTLFEQGNGPTIIGVIDNSVFGVVGIVIFLIITILFLATTLDSAAFSLSAASTKRLSSDEETSPMLRLFWCITLALLPLAMNYIGASLNNLQTITIVTSLPYILVMIGMTKGLLRWMKEDGN
ncbi:MAG: BCCT family transporter [Anaerovoracaceae bacterium]|jgi:BCCT family betaine/carnitine transporter